MRCRVAILTLPLSLTHPTTIIMTPENAKQLLYALKENVDKYEAHFGEIKPRQASNNPGGIMDFPLPKGQA